MGPESQPQLVIIIIIIIITIIIIIIIIIIVIIRDQPNSWEKMRDFMVEFLKCAKFHAKFTEGVCKIRGKFTCPTAVISRFYVNAN